METKGEDKILKVISSSECMAERSWIVYLLLYEFLGLDYIFEIGETKSLSIEAEGCALYLSDAFFQLAEKKWLLKESLPTQPIKVWDTDELGFDVNLTNTYLPIIFGSAGAKVDKKSIRLNLDIFGSAFFMLSRYEEAIKPDRDCHDRFPSSASLAYQEDFLNRPIVNEYLEILWSCIQYLWPGLHRRTRLTRKFISVDVDWPYHAGTKNLKGLARQIGGDVLKRKSPLLAGRSISNYYKARQGNYQFDPYFPYFNWIMDVNEKVGNQVAFNFLADSSRYSLNEPVIRRLLKDIYSRNHEIGFHAGYDSYLNPAKTYEEANSLRKTLLEECIVQEELGGRQHYLRWATPITANNLEEAGLAYDSTLSYADCIGFRCGICYEFTFYDILNRKPLDLRERPLIIMEDLVLGDNMNIKDRESHMMEIMKSYKDMCEKFHGDFTLLWHNSYLRTTYDQETYLALL